MISNIAAQRAGNRTPRFAEHELDDLVTPLKNRIAELEAALATGGGAWRALLISRNLEVCEPEP